LFERLLVATTNPGKLREIHELLGDVSVTLVSLADIAPVPAPKETGLTLAENARLKATN
jgi:XTP/dITP diphosphohydrolase